MSRSLFDRHRLSFRPLRSRKNRVAIDDLRASVESNAPLLTGVIRERIARAATDIRKARRDGRPVVLVFGAHLIKNGLGPTIISFLESGWFTHLATNGAGIIHDWELAFLGKTSEHVQENIRAGQFGLWEETGFTLNLAILVGAHRGLGYGESIGTLVTDDGLLIPSETSLLGEIQKDDTDAEIRAAACDLLSAIRTFHLSSGFLPVYHPYKDFGLQAAAYQHGVPFTAHPMFGHDIIYAHPMSSGAAIGRTAERDFLSFANSIENMEGGVYLSVGSAVMSPMIFEKSISMAQNLAYDRGHEITDFSIYVVDLAETDWDWTKGEPSETDPAYYVRYLKSFSRVGGRMTYIRSDNRDFFSTLSELLISEY